MATVEVIPFAVFNRKKPIVVAVRVVKGVLKPGMDACVEGTGKVLGVITNVYENNERVLEGVVGEVYAIHIQSVSGDPPRLEETDLILVCTV